MTHDPYDCSNAAQYAALGRRLAQPIPAPRPSPALHAGLAALGRYMGYTDLPSGADNTTAPPAQDISQAA